MYLIHIKLFAGSHHKSTVPLSQCEVCFTNDRNRLRTTNFVSHKIEDHENKGLLSTGIAPLGKCSFSAFTISSLAELESTDIVNPPD